MKPLAIFHNFSQFHMCVCVCVCVCVYLQAHCYYVVLKSFNDAIEAKGMSPANEEIMKKLCSLYAMYWMVQNSGEFMAVSESHTNNTILCV